MSKAILGRIRRFLTLVVVLMGAVAVAGGVAAQETPAPGPDSDAGSIALLTVESPGDEDRVEFKVSDTGPEPVGDGFATVGMDFTLSSENGDQPLSTSASGQTQINVLAGDYTLTDEASGEAVSFTVAAGATTYVSVARFYVAQEADPAPTATAVVTATATATAKLPATGAGSAIADSANAVLIGLVGLAGLAAAVGVARLRRAG